MKLRRETQVRASADSVWSVLATEYYDAYLWASSINHSKASGDNGRICDTELGEFKESIELYDDASKQLAYTAKGEKMPFFVKRMLNSWRVTEQGNNKSLVSMELEVTMSFPFNILMAIPMRLQLSGVLKKAHEELKYYVEHDGLAHPRTIATAEKHRKKMSMEMP